MDKEALKPEEAGVVINGWRTPDRIWLMDLGGGDVTWCDNPDPDGEQADSVGYIRTKAPSDEVIDRMARAMVAAQYNVWEELDCGDHAYWCQMARAAYSSLSQGEESNG